MLSSHHQSLQIRHFIKTVFMLGAVLCFNYRAIKVHNKFNMSLCYVNLNELFTFHLQIHLKNAPVEYNRDY